MADYGKKAFIELLRGRVIHEGKVIPTLTVLLPEEEIPSFTFSVATISTLSDQICDLKLPDPENPDDVDADYVQYSVRRTTRKRSVSINVWAKDEDMKDYIFESALELIKKARRNHYSFCDKFNVANEICSHDNNLCAAKNMTETCPQSDIKEPRSFLLKYNIAPSSIEIMNEQHLDELSSAPEKYHVVLPVQFIQFDDELVPVGTIKNSTSDEEILGDSPKQIR